MRLPDVQNLLHLDRLFKRPTPPVERAITMPVLTAIAATPESKPEEPETDDVPAFDDSSGGRLSLVLQRIATDSNAIVDATPEALAAALRFVSRRSADPAGDAMAQSRRVCNAILVARLNLLIDFPCRLYVSASVEPGCAPRVWVRVGPHPERVRLPSFPGELLERTRSKDLDRASARALAYALGTNPPRFLNEFTAIVAGEEPAPDSMFMEMERRALEIVRTVGGLSVDEHYTVITIAKAQRPGGTTLTATRKPARRDAA